MMKLWNGFAAVVVMSCALTGCGSDSGGDTNSGGAGGTGSGGAGGTGAGGGTGGTGGVGGSAGGGGSAGVGGSAGGGGLAGSGGASGSGGAGGYATNVDFSVTAGTHTGKITECSFANKTATQLKMTTDVGDGRRSATINCNATEAGSFTAFFLVELWFFEDAVGTTQAADLKPSCSGSGCTGPGHVKITYQDGAKGILESGVTTLATNHSGSLTVGTFNSATGAVAGSVDLGFDEGAESFAVKGTFDGTLFDCGTTVPCGGKP